MYLFGDTENVFSIQAIYESLLEQYNKEMADAERIHAQLDFVPGSNILLEKLVSGKWDEQFFIVQPNTTITQGKFFDC